MSNRGQLPTKQFLIPSPNLTHAFAKFGISPQDLNKINDDDDELSDDPGGENYGNEDVINPTSGEKTPLGGMLDKKIGRIMESKLSLASGASGYSVNSKATDRSNQTKFNPNNEVLVGKRNNKTNIAVNESVILVKQKTINEEKRRAELADYFKKSGFILPTDSVAAALEAMHYTGRTRAYVVSESGDAIGVVSIVDICQELLVREANEKSKANMAQMPM